MLACPSELIFRHITGLKIFICNQELLCIGSLKDLFTRHECVEGGPETVDVRFR